jgi:hypothetical protein
MERGKSSMCPLKEELPINGCKCKRLMDVQIFLEKNWVKVDVCMYVCMFVCFFVFESKSQLNLDICMVI